MNKVNIDKMIPLAIEAIKTNICDSDKTKVNSKYSSYIDNFGSVVRQSTLLQTITLYNLESEKADRQKVYNLIEDLLVKRNHLIKTDKALFAETEKIFSGNDFYTKIDWQNRIFETVIACKYAIKLFEKTDNNKEE